MIDIITNIGWGLAALAVGAVALVVMVVVIMAPIIGAFFAYENFVSYQRQEKIRRFGKKSEAVLCILLLAVLCLVIGVLCFDTSEDKFGWPDAPGWMNLDTKQKAKKGCD